MVDPLQELRDAIAQIAETATEPQKNVADVAAPLVAGFVFEQVTNWGSLTYYDREFQIAALRATGNAAVRLYNFLCVSHELIGLGDAIDEDRAVYFAQMLGVNAAAAPDKSIVTAMRSYIGTLIERFDDTYLYE